MAEKRNGRGNKKKEREKRIFRIDLLFFLLSLSFFRFNKRERRLKRRREGKPIKRLF